MQNNIPEKTLLKIFDLIQKSGVENKVFTVSKYLDPNVGEKILQDYIQKGKVEDLDLSGNLNIQKLPKGLKVKTLYLIKNQTLKQLPKIEAERIFLNKTNIQKIEEGLTCELLDLNSNETLKHLPRMQAEKIQADFTNIQTIGEGLKCKELVLTGNQAIKHLPKMEVDEIWAKYTNIETIADGLECKLLDLRENKTLKEFPKRLKVGRLDLRKTYFSRNYTEAEIRELIKEGGGEVREINYYT